MDEGIADKQSDFKVRPIPSATPTISIHPQKMKFARAQVLTSSIIAAAATLSSGMQRFFFISWNPSDGSDATCASHYGTALGGGLTDTVTHGHYMYINMFTNLHYQSKLIQYIIFYYCSFRLKASNLRMNTQKPSVKSLKHFFKSSHIL